METVLAMLVVLGIFVGIPAVVGFAIAGVHVLTIGELVCSVDADCPSGYVCIDGRCMPQFRQHEGTLGAA